MMMAINRTRGTAIGGALFVSLLISGNSVSTVEANCLHSDGRPAQGH